MSFSSSFSFLIPALLTALPALPVVLSPREASAQAATPLERFEPAPAADALFSVPEASVLGDRRLSAGLIVSFARSPLVVEIDGEEGGDGAEVVSFQLTTHALFSLEIAHRLKLDIDIPITAAQGGDPGPAQAARGYERPPRAAPNDVREGVRLEVLRQSGARPAAAIAFSVWLPMGRGTTYTGGDSIRYAPSIVVGGHHRQFLWSATIGRRFASSSSGSLLGSEVLFGAGAAVRFGPLQVGPELFGSTVADERTDAFSRKTTGLELLGSARYSFGPFAIGAAAGPGLTGGIGTPSFRLLTTVAYAPQLPVRMPLAIERENPQDGSGRANSERAGGRARGHAGTSATGAQGGASTATMDVQLATADTDGDTVPDADDACPRLVGDPAPAAKRRGCPPDRDGDGIIDASDHCPDEPGAESPVADQRGCPADTDADGIADPADACPGEKGHTTADPKTNGCPASVRVEGTQIVIMQQIRFVAGRGEILGGSAAILEEVAQSLRAHPEIARVAVDGHTDNIGPERRNIELSQQRAVAVARWLIEHGIDARRLETRGFGPRRPLANNGTEEGRAQNRRVEFQILKRTTEGEAGWRDGPLE